MADEKDAFYVVKKGDVIGVYKSLSEVQPLLASSVSGDSLRVYKGYSLPQKAKERIVSHGLKGAHYSIAAADVEKGLFGRLVPCSYQEPNSSRAFGGNSSSKSLQGAKQFNTSEVAGSSSFSNSQNCAYVMGSSFRIVPSPCEVVGSSSFPNSQRCAYVMGSSLRIERSPCLSCILEFDGASKGNPGLAGAGAMLRAEDGSKVYRLREGVGIQTNNFAEYRGLILGLKHAIKKGYKHIHVKGDSMLVCNQIQGLWKINNPNIAYLCNEAKELRNKFLSFKINHVPREYNTEADAQANLAINLRAGQVEEDCRIL